MTAVALTADGRLAVSANAKESWLKLWDAARGRLTRVLGGRDGPLQTVTMTPDGSLAVSAAESGAEVMRERIWAASSIWS